MKKDIDGLKINKDKCIAFVDGLEIEKRMFVLGNYLPKIKIYNEDINDNMCIKYNDKDIPLRKEKVQDYYLLPKDIPINTEFKVKLESEKAKNEDYNYIINSTDDICLELRKYIEKSTSNNGSDSNIRGNRLSCEDCNYSHEYNPDKADYFISCLSLLGKLLLPAKIPIEKFDRIFSFFNENFEKTERKTAINLLDSLCFIDYDYKGYLEILAPELILTPCLSNCHRSALLIGCRDINFVKKFIQEAPKYKLKIVVKEQHSCNNRYLLPKAIIINASGDINNNYGEDDIAEFAKKMKISFKDQDKNYLFLKDLELQFKSLDDHKKKAQNDFSDFKPKIFNIETLSFEEKPDNFKIDKNLSLIEYKIQDWDYRYIIYLENEAYEIDKSIGRYLFLSKEQKYIIFRSKSPFGVSNGEKEKFAIPMKCPLPKSINRNLMLMSGIAPKKCINESRTYYIYEEVPNANLFQKLGQKPKENTKWIP